GPADAARSVRARRSLGKTSWSACPLRCGSPRGPRRAQPALRGLLPHPRRQMRLTQSLGQLGDLGLELLLARRWPRLPCHQPGTAGLEELPLPIPYRLLGHLRPPRRLRDSHLTGQDRQHDPDLLLSRYSRRSRHERSDSFYRSNPQQTGPATKSDARQRHACNQDDQPLHRPDNQGNQPSRGPWNPAVSPLHGLPTAPTIGKLRSKHQSEPAQASTPAPRNIEAKCAKSANESEVGHVKLIAKFSIPTGNTT